MTFWQSRAILHQKSTHFIRAEIYCRSNKVLLLQSRGILLEQQSVSAAKQRYIVRATKYFCCKAEKFCRSSKVLLLWSRDMLSVIIWLIRKYEISHPNAASTRLNIRETISIYCHNIASKRLIHCWIEANLISALFQFFSSVGVVLW